MSFKRAVRRIQGILGLCFEDAITVVDGVSYRDRKILLQEASAIMAEAPTMTDQELIEAIDDLLS